MRLWHYDAGASEYRVPQIDHQAELVPVNNEFSLDLWLAERARHMLAPRKYS
jgi:hypothetical protein